MPADQDITILALQKELSNTERLQFQGEYNVRRKSIPTSIVLSALLGGLGAHRFYLGEIGLGITYAVFCWTFIPAFLALIECFLLPDRVRKYNYRTAESIANSIKMLRPEP